MGRKHKPVVRLSRVDSERVDRGEVDSSQAVVQALNSPEATSLYKQGDVQARDAHERKLLEDVPPHFGKL